MQTTKQWQIDDQADKLHRAIKKAIRDAGLPTVKVVASKQVSGYSSVTLKGFQVTKETSYERKVHRKTGRVLVTWLPASQRPDEPSRMNEFRALAEAQGWSVVDGTKETVLVSIKHAEEI